MDDDGFSSSDCFFVDMTMVTYVTYLLLYGTTCPETRYALGK
jgi:hypothetical protein